MPCRAFWLQQAHGTVNSFIAPVQANDTDKSIFLASPSSLQVATAKALKGDREHFGSGIAEFVKLKIPLSVPAIFAASVRASILIVFALVVRLRFVLKALIFLVSNMLLSSPTLLVQLTCYFSMDWPFVLQVAASQVVYSTLWTGEMCLAFW